MTTDNFIAPPCNEKVEILYEDDHLLLINKPSGLLSLSGKNPLNKDSVYERILKDYPNAKMIHRLDFGTSGIMVLALSKHVNAHLTKQFQLRSVVKIYTATLYGHLLNDEGLIEAPIARDRFPYQKICQQTGKWAQSKYQVIARNQNPITGHKTTDVLFTPKTGRTHQLRIHSQFIGHPIIGCDLYNAVIDGVDTQALAPRLCLHASRLTFEHPISMEKIEMECPPSDYS